MDPSEHLLIPILVFLVAAFVQGYGGFGFGIVAMSLMVFTPIDLERGAALVTLISLPMLFVLLQWSSVRARPRWELVVLLFIGMMIGQPIGYRLLEALSRQPVFQVIFGLALIGFAIQGFYGRLQKALPKWSALPIGMLSGVITGAFASGGPPLVLYLYSRVKDPREMKATVQALFFLGSSYRLVLVLLSERGVTGELTWTALLCLAALVPVLWLAHWLSTRSSTRFFTQAVYALLGVFGLLIMARAFLG